MERLYTAFVSSTYLDLVQERELVARALLNQTCVPLGMEYFPSTGTDQWTLIKESIQAADFCLFILAGRYGSISDDGVTSWTHREYIEAAHLGKPMIFLLHGDISIIPAGKSEATARGRKKLDEFRSSIQLKTVSRFYRNDAELIDGLYASVAALKAGGKIEGWIPAGHRPVMVQETDFDRTYEELFTHSEYSLSACGDRLDLLHTTRRIVRGNEPTGLRRIAVDFTRDADSKLTFNGIRRPRLNIVSATRSGAGSIDLLQPRKTIGPAYVQDYEFSPPLGVDEVADVEILADIREYSFLYRDDLLQATMDTPIGPRDFDYLSRQISFPTRQLKMTVFLPDSLGIRILGPKVGRSASIDHAASARLVATGQYREYDGTSNGVSGHLMELLVPEPQYNRRYRLCWALPSRPGR